MSGENFSIHESSFSVKPEVVEAILQDRLAFAMFRQAIPKNLCDAVASRFRTSSLVHSRNDSVPGRVLGTFHYLKTPEQYIAESRLAINDLRLFFESSSNPFEDVINPLAKYFESHGTTFRQGGSGREQFCPMVIRSWQGNGEYQLKPHDDTAQLSYSAQQSLELTQVRPTVGALNICLENSSDNVGQGAVRIWNSRPDRDERHRLDIEVSGYPYPAELISRFAFVEIPIFPGDVYFINGKYIHAVVGGTGEIVRTTMACMLGHLDDKTIIYWS